MRFRNHDRIELEAGDRGRGGHDDAGLEAKVAVEHEHRIEATRELAVQAPRVLRRARDHRDLPPAIAATSASRCQHSAAACANELAYALAHTAGSGGGSAGNMA